MVAKGSKGLPIGARGESAKKDVMTNHGTSFSMDCKYEPYTSLRKKASLLQEDHLNWPNNQITVKPLLTL